MFVWVFDPPLSFSLLFVTFFCSLLRFHVIPYSEAKNKKNTLDMLGR